MAADEGGVEAGLEAAILLRTVHSSHWTAVVQLESIARTYRVRRTESWWPGQVDEDALRSPAKAQLAASAKTNRTTSSTPAASRAIRDNSMATLVTVQPALTLDRTHNLLNSNSGLFLIPFSAKFESWATHQSPRTGPP